MKDFVIDKIRKMQMSGLKEIDVAQFFGFSTTIDLRHMISQRHRANRIVLASMAKEMKEAGKTDKEISNKMGVNESTVRLLLDEDVLKVFERADWNYDGC